jgi:hypothetical protein
MDEVKRQAKKKYTGVLLAGGTIQSTSRKGLRSMATRRGTVVVDSWRNDDPPPFNSSDALAWDAYRARHGVSGSHFRG